MRLTVIRNSLKWTIFARGGVGLLPVVSRSNIGQCVAKDAGSSRGMDCEMSH